MCRRRGNTAPPRRHRLRLGVCVSLLLPLFFGGFLEAQTEGEGLVLEPQTRRELAAIQDLWIDWLASAQNGDTEQSWHFVDLLLTQAEALGMRSLPDLSTAASVQAKAFSTASEFVKADAAVSAAERLQPGSPAAAFAAMQVARNRGRPVGAVVSWGRGVVRTVRLSPWRELALGNVLFWVSTILVLAAFSFVGLMMAGHGGLLYEDLSDFLARSLPPPGHLLVVVLLLWPVLLPNGLLWVAVYWSVLLWGYGSLRERVTLIALWAFIGGLPVAVSEAGRRVDLEVSAPMMAIGNAADGRLTGSLFTDLGVVDALIPDSPAFDHLRADLHLRLGQWDQARRLYRRVLDAEPENVAAIADLGAAYFYDGDLEDATRFLQEAIELGEAPAQVYFNLSRALSEQYSFAESEAMLRTANTLDSRGVGNWIRDVTLERVVSVAGGLNRRQEIEKQLARAWRGVESTPLVPWRRMLSLPLVLVLIVPAVGVFLLARRGRPRLPRRSEPWFTGSQERVRGAFLPGLVEVEQRWPVRAWLALVLSLGLASAPFLSGKGLPMPLGFEGPSGVGAVLAVALLCLYVGLRWLRSSTGPEAGG
jgi:tetratricopeptide (TPR) repeat protein